MNVIRHAGTIAAALLLLVGVPVYRTGYFQNKLSGADAVSSATMILDQPSGSYAVLINRDRHRNEENLEVWERFFAGEEIGYLFEDISCMVADTDAAGLELAKSFQSRLPENQMTIRLEDITLMLSKAGEGRFDVIFMSKEMYDASGAEREAMMERTDLIEAEGI